MAHQGISVSEVAHRLGVAPATLRTWDRRYGLGPSTHEAGEHRRYSDEDLARLAVMRRLVVSGVPAAHAATVAKSAPVSLDNPLPLPKFQDREDVVASIVRALDGIDSTFVEALIRREILSSGVIATWNEILVPALVIVGKRWESTGTGIEVEHLTTPVEWRNQGMEAGAPFASAHTFFQTGPFRPRNLARSIENVVFTGSGTQPGVGVPMVLISGKLAAQRIIGK